MNENQQDRLAVIILTRDESLHIARCIDSVKGISDEIYVVDSESTDDTCTIAASAGAHVVVHRWPGNYSEQFNWALDNLPVKAGWILRLDADEYVTPELAAELKQVLPGIPHDVNGLSVPLRRVFLNRILRRGNRRITMMRIFRRGKGRCERRLMDEHIELSGGTVMELKGEFVDHNLNNLSWWTQKHVGYAIREAVDLLDMEYDLTGAANDDAGRMISDQAKSKRMKKHKYSRLPLFWRSAAYFVYRYILLGGFTEGKEGFLWHFLQGWWYRTLVDAKVMEIKRRSGGDRERILRILAEEYGINLTTP